MIKGTWHPTEEQRRKMSEARRGRKLSPEHIAAIRAGKARPEVRQRASESHMGLPGPNKGKKRTLESRQKQSASLMGKPLSPEHAAAVVASQRTPEARAKMSESLKRAYEEHPETREKQRAATLAVLQRPGERERRIASVRKLRESAEFRARHKAAMNRPEVKERLASLRRGKPLSEETKAKIRVGTSAGQRKRWARVAREDRSRFTHNGTTVSLALRSMTSLEQKVKSWLQAHSVTFEQQHIIGWYHVDFYVASLNLVVEANGCFWHSCQQCGHDYPKRAAFDARKSAYLIRHGYALVTLWEHDVKRGDFSALAAALGME